jgi:hypothetical protein
VQIVNAGSGTTTSVILAPAGFDPKVPLLVAPSGPKAAGVTGSWAIPNVPDGQYAVLVAWENDGLVLDPDPLIGSAPVTIDVNGADVNAGSFKVTGALDVVSPPDGSTASSPPSFVWQDDAGEDHYELRVFDPSGALVHEDVSVPAVSGATNVTYPYAGALLASGATHQFVAVSVSSSGIPITRTENLRGVFVAP